MRAEYDFSKAVRKALIPNKGKTRISIFIDNAVLDAFRSKAESVGIGYQTMMNDALKQFLSESGRPITETSLRQILKEVLPTPQKRLTARSLGPRKSARPVSLIVKPLLCRNPTDCCGSQAAIHRGASSTHK